MLSVASPLTRGAGHWALQTSTWDFRLETWDYPETYCPAAFHPNGKLTQRRNWLLINFIYCTKRIIVIYHHYTVTWSLTSKAEEFVSLKQSSKAESKSKEDVVKSQAKMRMPFSRAAFLEINNNRKFATLYPIGWADMTKIIQVWMSRSLVTWYPERDQETSCPGYSYVTPRATDHLPGTYLNDAEQIGIYRHVIVLSYGT
jgi:hypothetical protein